MSSRLAVVEVAKAIARVSPATDPGPIFAHISFVELDPDLALLAGNTGDPGLRALDAIHLASALRVAHEIDAFVTYDTRQATAAHAIGLRVRSPGAASPPSRSR